MTVEVKLRQGTTAWFEMVGALMCEAASQADLATDLSLSLVERYTDGTNFGDGLVQGIRFDVLNGKPSFRIGVSPGERGDVTIEVTSAAARKLNLLQSTDPDYRIALKAFLTSGDMHVDGNPLRLGAWLEAVHDRIVKRTD